MPIDLSIKYPRIRAPISYPGGKYYGIPILMPLMPRNLTAMASPFLGGGSMELSFALQGVRVHGYDGYKILVKFWREVLRDPSAIATIARRHQPMDLASFKAVRDMLLADEVINELPDSLAAGLFYMIIRSSYSMMGLSAGPKGLSKRQGSFTASVINRLEGFTADGLSVEHADFADSIARHPSDFLYCDPPYAIKDSTLYGSDGDMHKTFDHQKLASILKSRDNWALSYNESAEIRDLYAGDGRIFVSVHWSYAMAGNKQRRELLILSPDAAARGITDGASIFFNANRELCYEEKT